MINHEDYDILKNNISTLKETSKDNHNNESETFMTQSMLPAVDFDEVKNEYIRKLHLSENPTSNDALLVLSDKIIFIEFKNGHLDRKDFFDIRAKIYNSVPILTDILDKGISFTRKNVDYILVYNKTKNMKNYIKNHISQKAKQEIIDAGLERFKNYFFRTVHTYDAEEFEDYLQRIK